MSMMNVKTLLYLILAIVGAWLVVNGVSGILQGFGLWNPYILLVAGVVLLAVFGRMILHCRS